MFMGHPKMSQTQILFMLVLHKIYEYYGFLYILVQVYNNVAGIKVQHAP